ncbi:hypothetical protein OBBRIDRAFT_377442 [Obba rivulosa]|uniref:Uncharacterized protein n=1 Tax=Obba rivulosa TaxID=1052685 RepID=A0A8E2AMW5_9APHY|nr:hypothetical protein OBBRIDRAFT_377442 [Obba rivulosa]
MEDKFALMHQASGRTLGKILRIMIPPFQQTMENMIVAADGASRVLALHTAHADSAQRAQLGATEAAKRLAHTLDELASHAHEEMQIINSTAMALQEQLSTNAGNTLWLAWGTRAQGMLLAFGQAVLRVDPAWLEHLGRLPAVRVIMVLTGLLWRLLLFLSSRFASAILLAASMTRWQSRARSGTGPPWSDRESVTESSASYMSATSRPRTGGYGIPRHRRARMSRIPDRLFSPTPDALSPRRC